MSALLAAMFGLVFYMLVRLLHLTQPSSAPLLYVKDRSSDFVQSVLTLCPILNQPYVPTLLWGKSGHIQTILYAKMGRVNMPVPNGVRHTTGMADGATLTFDLYEPEVPHKTGGSYCIIFCPGIGNSSESPYIRTLVHHAQKNGYISVVLNHLGSLKNTPLSSPRIFSYGGTEELGLVRAEVERLYPHCHLVLVGLSMGANIVVKYLGESAAHQKGILAAVSFCQGYDVNRAVEVLTSWTNLRQGYVYVMTANQKRIIKRHKDILLSDEEKQRIGVADEQEVFSAHLLSGLDEAYTRKLFGFNSREEFYHHSSCSHYLSNVQTPLLIVNSADDPIVPETLFEYPLEASQKLQNCIYAITKHGGHLGFFEHGWFWPHSLTWMDRLIVEFADAITSLHNSGELEKLTTLDESKGREEIKESADFVVA
ncbi:monoacylglycerol lipase ABHD2 [Aplysia californica]|uniref:Monoacylglycerol lipase ABHD2 n=1 Tax=Aplysia californica TaxID=6500 RepID=A0ABM0JHX1_APLCA|nr:monoacylglycerol lipase ABHD2 [Aplysia californica]